MEDVRKCRTHNKWERADGSQNTELEKKRNYLRSVKIIQTTIMMWSKKKKNNREVEHFKRLAAAYTNREKNGQFICKNIY